MNNEEHSMIDFDQIRRLAGRIREAGHHVAENSTGLVVTLWHDNGQRCTLHRIALTDEAVAAWLARNN